MFIVNILNPIINAKIMQMQNIFLKKTFFLYRKNILLLYIINLNKKISESAYLLKL